MNTEKIPLHICITGSNDFVRRMAFAASEIGKDNPEVDLRLATGSLAEARSLVLAERPDVFLSDISFNTTRRDANWLHELLSQIRSRFQKQVYTIVAITNSEKLLFGGNLLFENEVSLSPSGLVDNFIITAPPGIPSIATLEEQLQDCLQHVIHLIGNYRCGSQTLPALWEEGWVPSMCDPKSRNVWMRWLPRYARYVNENPIIVGPTGSGKTRLAAAIHKLSGRTGPFVSITPRDFSSAELVQAELFGAVSGAYTGAVDKWGLVKKAEKGSLFIDELQSIGKDLQGKLITFIENKTYRRVGEAESHHADVRFIFATNRPLQKLVEEGTLRDDFAYRLERLQLGLGSLKERRLDIASGIAFALGKISRERGEAMLSQQEEGPVDPHVVEGLSPGAYRSLFSAGWPGNLRQLENTIAKLTEIAHIENKRLIESDFTEHTLHTMLGRELITSVEYSRACSQHKLQGLLELKE